MADVEYSHDMGAYGRDAPAHHPEVHKASSLTTWTNMAGAAMSLALIAGVGVWGYKLMVRDVSGIPVVRAATTEMRVRPEDPGGQLAEHQGLAVNEIAASGAASGPVDQVTLAPPAVALAQEDQPVSTARAEPVVHPKPLEPAANAFTADGSSSDLIADGLQQGAIDDVVAELMGETQPVAPEGGTKVVQARGFDSTDPNPQPAVLREEQPVVVLTGLQRSMRPRLRPANAGSLARPAAYTPPDTKEVDSSAIPSGTRLAQLGAFDSADVAREEWNRMQQKLGDILEGKSRVVQQAQSGGRTFYRLRAMGFVDISDTRRFCSAVKAEGVDCIPVQVK